MSRINVKGTTVLLLDSTGSTDAERIRVIGKVTGANSLGGNASQVDVTDISSTATEADNGLPTGGNPSLDYNTASSSGDDDNHKFLMDESGSNKEYVLVLLFSDNLLPANDSATVTWDTGTEAFVYPTTKSRLQCSRVKINGASHSLATNNVVKGNVSFITSAKFDHTNRST